MQTLQVLNPSGATEITKLHAARLDSLDGKTVALLSNDSWQAHRTLPLVQELLQGRFPKTKFISANEFPKGNNHIDAEKVADMMVEKGVDAVIVGNAA